MMKPIFLSLFFLVFFAASPARAALFCGMRKNVACLIEAINEGRSSRVVKNLQAGVDPNGDEDGRTPILPPKNAPAVAPRASPNHASMRKTEYNHNRTENTEIYTARTSVARQNKKLKLNDRAFYIMIKQGLL